MRIGAKTPTEEAAGEFRMRWACAAQSNSMALRSYRKQTIKKDE